MNDPATKSIFKSKTYLVNFVIAVGAYLWPAVGEFVSKNPDTALWAMVAINLALRKISHGKVALFGE